MTGAKGPVTVNVMKAIDQRPALVQQVLPERQTRWSPGAFGELPAYLLRGRDAT